MGIKDQLFKWFKSKDKNKKEFNSANVFYGEPNKTDYQKSDLVTFAFEGISIDFKFNSNQPSLKDLILISGKNNPNKLTDSNEFEKLNYLGFEQTDDYFGIKNNTDSGDDIKLWLFPLINGEDVYHNEGPYEAMRLTYIVLRNDPNTANLFYKVFNAFRTNLDVSPTFEGRTVNNYEVIEKAINQTVQYCRQELKVEPGSGESLHLDW